MTNVEQVAANVAEQLAGDVPEVRLMRLCEGDVVVIRCDNDHLTESDLADLADRLNASVSVPGVQFVVLGPDADVEILRKDSD